MIDNVTLSTLTSLNRNVQPITVVTGLRYNTSLVKVFNNLTFLYDPNWEYQQGEPTYPIAFFYVKSMTEQMSSDVSQKPMLFYNTAGDSNDSTKGGLMNIVADNVVLKPKVYKLDIIIPADGSTLKNSSFSFDAITNVNGFLFSNGEFRASTGLDIASRIVNISLGVLETLFKGLYGTSVSASSICNMLLQQQDYNKASIEYMWSNRRILKLKLWNGWKFKYLIIKDFDVTKIGENGDFYEGTLTCQEVPILTFRRQAESASLTALSKISKALGKLQKTATDTFIKAMTATYGE
jgi:hypothetical protein